MHKVADLEAQMRAILNEAAREIDRKAYDILGNLRQKGEDEDGRCFTQNAPKQASFAEATR